MIDMWSISGKIPNSKLSRPPKYLTPMMETECNYCFHFCHCWQQESKILTISLSFTLSPYIFVITPHKIKPLSLSEHWLLYTTHENSWVYLHFLFRAYFKNKIINCLTRFFSLGLLGNILFLDLHNLGKS
jgi:hypothetical protein